MPPQLFTRTAISDKFSVAKHREAFLPGLVPCGLPTLLFPASLFAQLTACDADLWPLHVYFPSAANPEAAVLRLLLRVAPSDGARLPTASLLAFALQDIHSACIAMAIAGSRMSRPPLRRSTKVRSAVMASPFPTWMGSRLQLYGTNSSKSCRDQDRQPCMGCTRKTKSTRNARHGMFAACT